jgi:predicted RNase H-like HicB family nuclease
MRSLKYVVYSEGKYFVSQCLNVDVASFGKTIDEAVANLKDAVELYLKDDPASSFYHEVGDALVGEAQVNA